MVIVDAHVHSSPLWFEPVESLLYQMESNGVNKAVLVPFTGNYSGYEVECTRKHPGRFAPLTMVDVTRPDALDVLEFNAQKGAVGIRIGLQDTFPRKDPLAVWRKAAQLGLNVSCHGAIDLFVTAEFRRAVEEFPGLKIVLEHLAGAARTKRFPNPNYQLFDQVIALAKYPNVYVKLPGFGEILDRKYPMAEPTFDHIPPQIMMVYEAFGPKRMMWGSDFPPCSQREGYANALRYPLERVPFFTQDDKEWIFGKTALSVWDFPPR